MVIWFLDMDLSVDFEDDTIDLKDELENEFEVANEDENMGSSSKSKETKAARKRKRTSHVWKSFEMISKDKKGTDRCKCKWCTQIYVCQTSSGTGNMIRHLALTCPKYKSRDIRQMVFEKSNSGSIGVHQPKTKTQEEFRKLVAETLVLHDLPFQFVEWTWIRKINEYLDKDFT